MFAKIYWGFEDVAFYAASVEEFPDPVRRFFGRVGGSMFWLSVICRDPHRAIDLAIERYVERRTGTAFCLPARN
jgi:hypothetical protein